VSQRTTVDGYSRLIKTAIQTIERPPFNGSYRPSPFAWLLGDLGSIGASRTRATSPLTTEASGGVTATVIA